MDKSGAERLAQRIERDSPGDWQSAQARYDAAAGEWHVKARTADGTVATFAGPFAYHYFQRKVASTLFRVKALRMRLQQRRRAG